MTSSVKVVVSLFLLVGVANGAIHENYQISRNTSDLGFHLESPNVTDFGSWGKPEFCSRGQLVTGFQLRIEPKHSVDDTALNAIRFYCAQPAGSNENRKNITSKVGHFGNWGNVLNCTTYAVGFELESQPYQGKREDDTAANNLKLYCADGTVLEGFNNNGHSFKDAKYTGPQMCSAGQGLCGLQTQVERYQVFGDDTALNNLRAKCCNAVELPQLPAAPVIPILGVSSVSADSSPTPAPAENTPNSDSVAPGESTSGSVVSAESTSGSLVSSESSPGSVAPAVTTPGSVATSESTPGSAEPASPSL